MVVPGAVGAYPLAFSRTANSREHRINLETPAHTLGPMGNRWRRIRTNGALTTPILLLE